MARLRDPSIQPARAAVRGRRRCWRPSPTSWPSSSASWIRRAGSPSATRTCSWARSRSSRSARPPCSSSSASTRSGGATSGCPTSGRWSGPPSSRWRCWSWSSRSPSPIADDLPRSVVVFDFLLLTVLTGGARLLRRTLAERPARAARKRKARKVLVVGAGSGGQMVVREMQLNPNLGNRAIGFVDDDPRKRGHAQPGAGGAGHHRRDRRDLRPHQARRGLHRDPLGAGHAAGEGGRRLPRARHPCADAADRVRAPARRRAAHPPAARGPGGGRARAATPW